MPVQFSNAAPHIRPDLDGRDVAQCNGDATCRRPDRQCTEIVEIGEITARTDDIFGLGLLDHRAARLLVAALDRVDHRLLGHAVSDQLVGIEHDLILPHHPADGRDFANPGDRLQLVAQEPVLQAAQFGKVVAAAMINQRIFIDPADPGRIGPQLSPGARGQLSLHLAQIFEHPAARPVEVGIVLEEHIDQAVADERIAAHDARPGH